MNHIAWASAFAIVAIIGLFLWAGNEGSKRQAELQKLCIEHNMSWETLHWGGPTCMQIQNK